MMFAITTPFPRRWLFISVFLSACALVCALLPGVAHAVVGYNLWVGNVRVTSANADDVLGDGTVRFEAAQHRLSLKNARIRSSAALDDFTSGISSHLHRLDIALHGSNSIHFDSVPGHAAGIYHRGQEGVYFSGQGELTVTMPEAEKSNYGVYSSHHVRVDGPRLFVQSGLSQTAGSVGVVVGKDLEMLSGSLNARAGRCGYLGCPSTGIRTNFGMLRIAGGEVVASGFTGAGAESMNSVGIEGWAHSANATVIAMGATKAYSQSGHDFGVGLVSVNTVASDVGASVWDGSTDLGGEESPYAFVRYQAGVPSSSPQLFNVWVSGRQVSADNKADVLGDGTVSFSPETATLRLKGAKLQGHTLSSGEYETVTCALCTLDPSLTIQLDGDSTITGIDSVHRDMGIYHSKQGQLAFKGSGSLTVSPTAAAQGEVGVLSKGLVLLDGPTLSIVSGAASLGWATGLAADKSVTVKSGLLRAEAISPAQHTRGVMVTEGSIELLGGEVVAHAQHTGSLIDAESYGISAVHDWYKYGMKLPAVFIGDAQVTAMGDTRAFEYIQSYVGPRTVMVNTQARAEGAVVWDRAHRLGGFPSPYKYVHLAPAAKPQPQAPDWQARVLNVLAAIGVVTILGTIVAALVASGLVSPSVLPPAVRQWLRA
ncbi:hypothetical protein P4N68_04450 [Corynebacterium felinum]|uniref:Uncharacterized protein n=1 Tax=Corynebacterium felinum TaxID=131318 RepID=A0ABU2B518_9CORY|nr:hypothetical protein [Corynebacterium felinum]MDF5820336.1 hypothetical protein [Corynebacterium felinum]MDR7353703.1 hypothetical protein [Corynebacterium felinum]WJY95882.1 hypothetical protein CFELI_11460 [Corynebacterium felinum]